MDNPPVATSDRDDKAEESSLLSNSSFLQSAYIESNTGYSNMGGRAQFYRTRICPSIKAGKICERGNRCFYAHEKSDLRPSIDLAKTKMCLDHAQNKCTKGDSCPFAHHPSQLKATPGFYKTSICKFYSRGTCCPAGDNCRHAHGVVDLVSQKPKNHLRKLTREVAHKIGDSLDPIKLSNAPKKSASCLDWIEKCPSNTSLSNPQEKHQKSEISILGETTQPNVHAQNGQTITKTRLRRSQSMNELASVAKTAGMAEDSEKQAGVQLLTSLPVSHLTQFHLNASSQRSFKHPGNNRLKNKEGPSATTSSSTKHDCTLKKVGITNKHCQKVPYRQNTFGWEDGSRCFLCETCQMHSRICHQRGHLCTPLNRHHSFDSNFVHPNSTLVYDRSDIAIHSDDQTNFPGAMPASSPLILKNQYVQAPYFQVSNLHNTVSQDTVQYGWWVNPSNHKVHNCFHPCMSLASSPPIYLPFLSGAEMPQYSTNTVSVQNPSGENQNSSVLIEDSAEFPKKTSDGNGDYHRYESFRPNSPQFKLRGSKARNSHCASKVKMGVLGKDNSLQNRSPDNPDDLRPSSRRGRLGRIGLRRRVTRNGSHKETFEPIRNPYQPRVALLDPSNWTSINTGYSKPNNTVEAGGGMMNEFNALLVDDRAAVSVNIFDFGYIRQRKNCPERCSMLSRVPAPIGSPQPIIQCCMSPQSRVLYDSEDQQSKLYDHEHSAVLSDSEASSSFPIADSCIPVQMYALSPPHPLSPIQFHSVGQDIEHDHAVRVDKLCSRRSVGQRMPNKSSSFLGPSASGSELLPDREPPLSQDSRRPLVDIIPCSGGLTEMGMEQFPRKCSVVSSNDIMSTRGNTRYTRSSSPVSHSTGLCMTPLHGYQHGDPPYLYCRVHGRHSETWTSPITSVSDNLIYSSDGQPSSNYSPKSSISLLMDAVPSFELVEAVTNSQYAE